jgi:hypothetical protein
VHVLRGDRPDATIYRGLALNLAFVIAVSPSSDYRYLYFVYLSFFAAPLLMLAEHRFLSRRGT